MDGLLALLNSWWEWIISNSMQFVLSVVIFAVIYVGYKFISRQITRLKREGKIEENTAFILIRFSKWIAGLIFVGAFFTQLGLRLGVIGSLFALSGGTIIGFAAMNTIGNAIAGIIIMISHPFKVGDRIFFQGQLADVSAIDLIYTRLRTLDNVYVSIPNQELLTSEIGNYGRKRVIRRACTITAGYELDFNYVEKALLTAVNKVGGVLKKPKPYVWITDFKDFAVEYTLYVFVNKIRQLPEIDADLKKAVLETCKSYEIDISTPSLVQSIDSSPPLPDSISRGNGKRSSNS